MASKLLGYILIGIGFLVILLSYPSISKALKITLPLNDLYVMIIGIVIILVGTYIGFKRSSSQPEEVPIYHGEKIVGYRRK